MSSTKRIWVATFIGAVAIPLLVLYVLPLLQEVIEPHSRSLALAINQLGFLLWPFIWLQLDTKHYLDGVSPFVGVLLNGFFYATVCWGMLRWRALERKYWLILVAVLLVSLALGQHCGLRPIAALLEGDVKSALSYVDISRCVASSLDLAFLVFALLLYVLFALFKKSPRRSER